MSDDEKILVELSKLTGKEFKKIHGDFIEHNIENVDFIYGAQEDNVIYIGLNFYYLDLSEKDLNKIYNSLSNLKSLKGLSLYYKTIDKVPEFIRNFKDLESLTLKDFHLEFLPEWLKELRNLRRLSLVHYDLKSLPEWIKELENLSHLNLESNDLKSLPEWLETLRKLRILKVKGNDLEWNEINTKILNMVVRKGGEITAPRLFKFQGLYNLSREKIEIIREIEQIFTERERNKRNVSEIPIKVENDW